jgi:hypothetical protein
MLHDPPLQEDTAWREASDDDSWAKYATAVYTAAVKRSELDTGHGHHVE